MFNDRKWFIQHSEKKKTTKKKIISMRIKFSDHKAFIDQFCHTSRITVSALKEKRIETEREQLRWKTIHFIRTNISFIHAIAVHSVPFNKIFLFALFL